MNNNENLKRISGKLISKNRLVRSKAVDEFLEKYCPVFSEDSTKLNFGNKENNSLIMENPSEYSRWMLNFAVDFILLSNGTTFFEVTDNTTGYVEISYNTTNSSNYEDSYVVILSSKNGLVIEINGEILSIAKNKNEKDMWNVNFSENLGKSVPLVRKRTRVNKYIKK